MFDRRKKIIIAVVILVALLAGVNIYLIKKRSDYKDLAYKTFTDAGVDAEKFMRGINFRKKVEILQIDKGQILIQWQIPSAKQGNFYAFIDSKPNEIGIRDVGYDQVQKKRIPKEKRFYKATRNVDVLSSYAGAVTDDWSTPQDEERINGTKIQLFTTCKECFKREKRN